MGKEITALRAKIGTPIYPKPRYNVSECLILLDETRKTFYAKVKKGRYQLTKDGSRSYMTHDSLLDAAQGDRANASSAGDRLQAS